MIISNKNKYLFVELPRTGTTAISKELIANYDGESILWKHAPLNKFLQNASAEQKSYFVFACMRNPIDRTFSLYNKLLNDHGNEYSVLRSKRFYNLQAWYFYRQFQFINEHNASFADYLKKFYSVLPYDDWITLDYSFFDKVIRFDKLNEDFKNTLAAIGLEIKRDLPSVNTTRKMSSMSEELDNDSINLLNRVFGVYLQKMGFQLPNGLGKLRITKAMLIKYEFFHLFKAIYWRFFKKAKFSKSKS